MKKPYIFILIFVSVLVSAFFLDKNNSKSQDDEIAYTLAQFNTIINNSKKPVFIYFHADWCMVCPKLKPIIAEIENEYTAKFDFIQINTEKSKEIRDELGIDALPVIMVYKGGKNVWTYVGLTDKKNIKTNIETL